LWTVSTISTRRPTARIGVAAASSCAAVAASAQAINPALVGAVIEAGHQLPSGTDANSPTASELLLLAEKIPEPIRRDFFELPDAFRLIARLDVKRLDRVLAFLRGR